MGKTIRGERGPSYEYGKSRYHKGYEKTGRFTKKKTHKRERSNIKKNLKHENEY